MKTFCSKPKNVFVKTLLDVADLKREKEHILKSFWIFTSHFKLNAYDEKEILCEKVRAILTRKSQKLRDFYDLFVLQKHGFYVEDFENEIIEKIKASLYYKKYRDALERNKERLEVGREVLEDLFERNLFVEKPKKEFDDFLKAFIETLRKIADKCSFL